MLKNKKTNVNKSDSGFAESFSEYMNSFIQYEKWIMIEDYGMGVHNIWVDTVGFTEKKAEQIFKKEIVNCIAQALKDKEPNETIQFVTRNQDSSTGLISALFKAEPSENELYLIKKNLFPHISNTIYMLDYLSSHKNSQTMNYVKAILSVPVTYEKQDIISEHNKDTNYERLTRVLSFLRTAHKITDEDTQKMQQALLLHLEHSENIQLMDNDKLMNLIKVINPHPQEEFIKQCFSLVHPHIQFADDLMQDIEQPVSQFKISHNNFIASTHFQTMEASKGFFNTVSEKLKNQYEKMGVSSLLIHINDEARGNPSQDDYTVTIVSNSDKKVNIQVIKKIIKSIIDYEKDNVNFLHNIQAQDVCNKVINDIVLFHTINEKLMKQNNDKEEPEISKSFKI
jgi:hypothetical protein